MKWKIKSSRAFKNLFVAGLLAASTSGMAQTGKAVIADPKLGVIDLSDNNGFRVPATNIPNGKQVLLTLPVSNNSHGRDLPAGSCKIKIGLGSKLILNPAFDLNGAGAGSYFKWSVTEADGQVQITGDLVNALPAAMSSIDVRLGLVATEEGNSAITANFLITNHNSTTVLSDENGANNVSAVSYIVGKGVAADPVAVDGKLKLSIFPNPVADGNEVTISVLQGKLMGKYSLKLYDMAGKILQVKEMQLDLLPRFRYSFGTLAAGKYLLKIVGADGTESAVLVFNKL